MKLKNTLLAVLTICLTASFISCSTTVSTKRTSSAKALPPGQAKKINGDKSARNYAPGHNKG